MSCFGAVSDMVTLLLMLMASISIPMPVRIEYLTYAAVQVSTSIDIGTIRIKYSKMKGRWSEGLLHTMRDPNSVVISTDKLVAIKDKYPKAQIHYLVLPYDNIPSIFHLNTSHSKLLQEMSLLALNLIEISGRGKDDFYVGYHASPHMERLHLHVISNDFNSPCLKTKIHWNSFTTAFFLSPDYIMQELTTHGRIQKLPDETLKEYLATDLTCHKCSSKLSNMPRLKEHIGTHL